MQTVSRTLIEELKFDRSRVTSVDWESYPILRFPDVPDIAIDLIDRPERSAVGGRRADGGRRAFGDRKRDLRRDRRPAAFRAVHTAEGARRAENSVGAVHRQQHANRNTVRVEEHGVSTHGHPPRTHFETVRADLFNANGGRSCVRFLRTRHCTFSSSVMYHALRHRSRRGASTDAFPLVIVLHGRRSAERAGMGCSEERT